MGLKMKGEVLDEVVRRLRSGEYQQGAAALRRLPTQDQGEGDRYCCLGIVCEMAVEAGVLSIVSTPTQPGASYGYAVKPTTVYTAYLPPAVIEWAGIVSDMEKYPDMGDHYYEERGQWGEGHDLSLASMNDSAMPFPEIADWMEANVERV